jgi:hypothetical protein
VAGMQPIVAPEGGAAAEMEDQPPPSGRAALAGWLRRKGRQTSNIKRHE